MRLVHSGWEKAIGLESIFREAAQGNFPTNPACHTWGMSLGVRRKGARLAQGRQAKAGVVASSKNTSSTRNIEGGTDENEVWVEIRQSPNARLRHVDLILQPRGCKLVAHRMTLTHRYVLFGRFQ